MSGMDGESKGVMIMDRKISGRLKGKVLDSCVVPSSTHGLGQITTGLGEWRKRIKYLREENRVLHVGQNRRNVLNELCTSPEMKDGR